MTLKIQDITCPYVSCDICSAPVDDGETYICLYHKPNEWNIHERCADPSRAMLGDIRDKLIREGYMKDSTHDAVNHPDHYTAGGIEVIDFIEAKELCFHRANAVKYIARADLKGNAEQDIRKAIFYLNRYLVFHGYENE